MAKRYRIYKVLPTLARPGWGNWVNYKRPSTPDPNAINAGKGSKGRKESIIVRAVVVPLTAEEVKAVYLWIGGE